MRGDRRASELSLVDSISTKLSRATLKFRLNVRWLKSETVGTVGAGWWPCITSRRGTAEMAAIEATGLVKTFRTRKNTVKALDGIDLEVPEGSVLGLLGPNGAGKTTAVRVLTTLMTPDAGSARVLGHDVVKEADTVRSLVGLSGQYAAVDELLTGRENLWMFGRLYRLSSQQAEQRAEELLDTFDLTDAADRILKTYSGGMRRRLDLAGSLIAHPKVLFLDEPTTGLDPRQPARPVADHPRPGQRGRHHPAHHAVPRRGRRAGRQHRGGRPRLGDRPRYGGRAQGEGRWRADRGRRPRPGRDLSRAGVADRGARNRPIRTPPRSTSTAGGSPCRRRAVRVRWSR